MTGSALYVKQDGGKRKCTFCHGDHGKVACKAVEDPEERKKIIARQGRCFIFSLKVVELLNAGLSRYISFASKQSTMFLL